MTAHTFLFAPGDWIGEGKVTFSASPTVLRFYTRWHTSAVHAGVIDCRQDVEMQEQTEHTRNFFAISEIEAKRFTIELTSDIIGTVAGQGLIDDKTVAWEFHHAGQFFEGFEVYERQGSAEYVLHAEYASTDQLRTMIDGRIWLKSSFT